MVRQAGLGNLARPSRPESAPGKVIVPIEDLRLNSGCLKWEGVEPSISPISFLGPVDEFFFRWAKTLRWGCIDRQPDIIEWTAGARSIYLDGWITPEEFEEDRRQFNKSMTDLAKLRACEHLDYRIKTMRCLSVVVIGFILTMIINAITAASASSGSSSGYNDDNNGNADEGVGGEVVVLIFIMLPICVWIGYCIWPHRRAGAAYNGKRWALLDSEIEKLNARYLPRRVQFVYGDKEKSYITSNVNISSDHAGNVHGHTTHTHHKTSVMWLCIQYIPTNAPPLGGAPGAGPPAGYGAPPGGYAAPPGGYAAPPGGYAAPPGGYAAPPGGYGATAPPSQTPPAV